MALVRPKNGPSLASQLSVLILFSCNSIHYIWFKVIATRVEVKTHQSRLAAFNSVFNLPTMVFGGVLPLQRVVPKSYNFKHLFPYHFVKIGLNSINITLTREPTFSVKEIIKVQWFKKYEVFCFS